MEESSLDADEVILNSRMKWRQILSSTSNVSRLDPDSVLLFKHRQKHLGRYFQSDPCSIMLSAFVTG